MFQYKLEIKSIAIPVIWCLYECEIMNAILATCSLIIAPVSIIAYLQG